MCRVSAGGWKDGHRDYFKILSCLWTGDVSMLIHFIVT